MNAFFFSPPGSIYPHSHKLSLLFDHWSLKNCFEQRLLQREIRPCLKPTSVTRHQNLTGHTSTRSILRRRPYRTRGFTSPWNIPWWNRRYLHSPRHPFGSFYLHLFKYILFLKHFFLTSLSDLFILARSVWTASELIVCTTLGFVAAVVYRIATASAYSASVSLYMMPIFGAREMGSAILLFETKWLMRRSSSDTCTGTPTKPRGESDFCILCATRADLWSIAMLLHHIF